MRRPLAAALLATLAAALAGCAAPPPAPSTPDAPAPTALPTQAPAPTAPPTATRPSLSLPTLPPAPPTATRTPEPSASPRPPAAATRCPAPVTEATAAACVDRQVQRDRLYDSWTTRTCLRVIIEGSGPDGVDVAVRERHEPPCPGDPNVDPIVDRFRVTPGGELLWLDYASNAYVAYADVRSERAP